MQSAVNRFPYGAMARLLFPSQARDGVVWLDSNTRVQLNCMGALHASQVTITVKDEDRRVYDDIWFQERSSPSVTNFRAGRWIKALLEKAG